MEKSAPAFGSWRGSFCFVFFFFAGAARDASPSSEPSEKSSGRAFLLPAPCLGSFVLAIFSFFSGHRGQTRVALGCGCSHALL
jgi:hypothetical protein